MVLRHTQPKALPTVLSSLPNPPGRDGCPQHQVQKVGGKPLKFLDHYKAMCETGLISHPKQLEKASLSNASFKPPGASKKVGGRQVFPHFG